MKSPPQLDSIRKTVTELWQKWSTSLGLANKPDMEVNPPKDQENKGKREFIAYLLLLITAIWLWQAINEIKQNEIPYSDFLKYVGEKKIDSAIVTEQAITGQLKPEAPNQTPKPYATIPLWNQPLAEAVQKQGVN